MNETTQIVIKQITNTIYDDALAKQLDNHFLILKYHPSEFVDIIDDVTFRAVVNFLPNTNYNGKPLVMSVANDKSNGNVEITVYNPRVK